METKSLTFTIANSKNEIGYNLEKIQYQYSTTSGVDSITSMNILGKDTHINSTSKINGINGSHALIDDKREETSQSLGSATYTIPTNHALRTVVSHLNNGDLKVNIKDRKETFSLNPDSQNLAESDKTALFGLIAATAKKNGIMPDEIGIKLEQFSPSSQTLIHSIEAVKSTYSAKSV